MNNLGLKTPHPRKYCRAFPSYAADTAEVILVVWQRQAEQPPVASNQGGGLLFPAHSLCLH